MLLLFACPLAAEPLVVGHAQLDLANLDLPRFADPAHTLDDLARSPLWAVSRDRSGATIASLRVVGGGPFADSAWFLGPWVAAGRPAIEDGPIVANSGWQARDVVDLDVQVRTTLPDGVTATTSDLPIEAAYSAHLDGNSHSTLALPLGEGLWLVVREQGSGDRSATRRALDVAAAELRRVATLPAGYRARDIYADVFAALRACPTDGTPCAPLPTPVRYAGLQDRDTLGLVFEVPAGADVDGVRVGVWEPTICGGECTLGYRQDQKVVLLGHPPAGDWAFALVEDNAIALDAAKTARYGTFSGTDAFSGEIRWTDHTGTLLWSGRGPFRGWER